MHKKCLQVFDVIVLVLVCVLAESSVQPCLALVEVVCADGLAGHDLEGLTLAHLDQVRGYALVNHRLTTNDLAKHNLKKRECLAVACTYVLNRGISDLFCLWKKSFNWK